MRVGVAPKFRRGLIRRQLAPFPSDGGGPYKGIKPANIRFDLYLACATKDGIDVKAYEALHTTLDFEAVYDLIEMQVVSSSWDYAAQQNARIKSENAAAAQAATPSKNKRNLRRARRARRGR